MAKAKKEEIVSENIKVETNEALEDQGIDTEMTNDQETPVDQEVDIINAEEQTNTEDAMPAEVAAINSDNETAQAANKKADTKKSTKQKQSKQAKKAKIVKTKSKKYQEKSSDIDKRKEHTVEEAVELVKKTSYSKFDGTITLDIKLSKAKKGEEAVRGTIKLPHSSGKTQNVAIVTEELIEEIKKGKTDFDTLLTTPEMMPKLAQVAKILGPKGKMPNPKDGTVVADPEEAAKEIGLTVRYRMDAGRNLHIAVGKVSHDSAELAENVKAILKALAHIKKDSATLSPTMGAGVKIAL